jgi:UDP-N-acetylmuramoylalanine--D-glutamate ligase
MRTLVLGAAMSGMAAAGLAQRLGHAVTVFDERPDAAAAILGHGYAAVTGRWDPTILDGFDLAVTSPGFPERSLPITEIIESGLPLISELEFGWRELGAPTVAVTGTNGKTTVTGLVADMLSASGLGARALGNIGDPVSAAVGATLDWAVLEASSFQLRFVERFHARIAVVTNVAPDHLDWHGSFESYLSAKARIVERQEEDDLLVFDGEDEGARRIASLAPGRTVEVSGVRLTTDGYGPDAGRLNLGSLSVELDAVGVDSPAFLMDLAAAAAAALGAGATPGAVERIVRGFRPGAHRRQVVAAFGGLTFVDDSKASNPHAALAAIRSFPSVVLIAGGRAKGLDVRPLAHEPAVRALVAIGEAGPDLLEAAGERGIPADSMEQAVALAVRAARPGDVVLLAPGCASWDMFESYAARGSAFSAAVRAIMESETESP